MGGVEGTGFRGIKIILRMQIEHRQKSLKTRSFKFVSHLWM